MPGKPGPSLDPGRQTPGFIVRWAFWCWLVAAGAFWLGRPLLPEPLPAVLGPTLILIAAIIGFHRILLAVALGQGLYYLQALFLVIGGLILFGY